MEEKRYDSLVISNTYDLEKLVMYPEKVAVARTYEELRHLISNGHILEVRDDYSNVVVDSIEKLDLLYKPSDLVIENDTETPITGNTTNSTVDVNTQYIRLPNGTVIDVNALMQAQNGQSNGYNIPNYIQSTPDVLPKATVDVTLNEQVKTPEDVFEKTTTETEEAKVEEEQAVEEENTEENTTVNEEEKIGEEVSEEEGPQKGKEKKTKKGDDK